MSTEEDKKITPVVPGGTYSKKDGDKQFYGVMKGTRVINRDGAKSEVHGDFCVQGFADTRVIQGSDEMNSWELLHDPCDLAEEMLAVGKAKTRSTPATPGGKEAATAVAASAKPPKGAKKA